MCAIRSWLCSRSTDYRSVYFDSLQGLNDDGKYINRIQTAFVAIYTQRALFNFFGALFNFFAEKLTFEMAKFQKLQNPPKSYKIRKMLKSPPKVTKCAF